MDSEWWLSNGLVSISGGYLKSPYHPVCPFICLSASSMCNYSHAKECVRNSIHCIRIIIIKPAFVLNHVQYSKILHTIGLFCGYAIRSGRHPEGSQLPPGRPHIAHGSWLYWIPQGFYPTYNSVQLYVWNYLKKCHKDTCVQISIGNTEWLLRCKGVSYICLVARRQVFIESVR